MLTIIAHPSVDTSLRNDPASETRNFSYTSPHPLQQSLYVNRLITRWTEISRCTISNVYSAYKNRGFDSFHDAWWTFRENRNDGNPNPGYENSSCRFRDISRSNLTTHLLNATKHVSFQIGLIQRISGTKNKVRSISVSHNADIL